MLPTHEEMQEFADEFCEEFSLPPIPIKVDEGFNNAALNRGEEITYDPDYMRNLQDSTTFVICTIGAPIDDSNNWAYVLAHELSHYWQYHNKYAGNRENMYHSYLKEKQTLSYTTSSLEYPLCSPMEYEANRIALLYVTGTELNDLIKGKR